MTRSEALIVRAFALWTAFVWGTRISTVVRDHSHSFAFKAIHVTLAVISVTFACAAWIVVRRARARSADR